MQVDGLDDYVVLLALLKSPQFNQVKRGVCEVKSKRRTQTFFALDRLQLRVLLREDALRLAQKVEARRVVRDDLFLQRALNAWRGRRTCFDVREHDARLHVGLAVHEMVHRWHVQDRDGLRFAQIIDDGPILDDQLEHVTAFANLLLAKSHIKECVQGEQG